MTVPRLHSLLSRKFLQRTVADLNPHPIISIPGSASIRSAVELLQAEGIGSLLVGDEHEQLSGIFTERDLLRRVALQGIDLSATSISQAMTGDPERIKSNASLARLLYRMSVGRFRHIIVEHPANADFRIVSAKDFVDFLYTSFTKKYVQHQMLVVADETRIDRFFADRISVIGPSEPVKMLDTISISQVLKVLSNNDLGSIVLVDKEGKLSGIFTERDYLTRVALKDLNLESTPISKVMTPNPRTALDYSSVSLVFNLMSEGGFRHIPLVDDSESLVGVVSVRNFLDYISAGILEELREMQEQ